MGWRGERGETGGSGKKGRALEKLEEMDRKRESYIKRVRDEMGLLEKERVG